MRKLKLESLQVQSFATTTAASASRGTVQARADSGEWTCVCYISQEWVCVSLDTDCPTACFGETEDSCPSGLDDC